MINYDRILKYIKHPSKFFLKLDEKGILRLPAKKYIELQFCNMMGYKLDLKNPKTFNEKLQWLKLYDRKKIYTKMVDKYDAKEYISNIIGEGYVIPTIGIYDSFDEIDFTQLPKQFVIKCTHDSGGYVICKDKSKLNIEEAMEKINSSLKNNYYWLWREWPYKNIKPRIIIEEYMEDKKSDELIDYKIMCFNGKAKMLFTCTERFSKSGVKVTFFDLDFNKLPFTRHYPSSKVKIEKPVNFEKMIEFAEKLSKNTTFLRVDFYEINKKLYIGELTFYPGAGIEEFEPKEWDYKLGEMIKLSRK